MSSRNVDTAREEECQKLLIHSPASISVLSYLVPPRERNAAFSHGENPRSSIWNKNILYNGWEETSADMVHYG